MRSTKCAYEKIGCFINGEWRQDDGGHGQEVINPATTEVISELIHATVDDLGEAVDTAAAAFIKWKHVDAAERSQLLRRVHMLVLERIEDVAHLITLDQGKVLGEAIEEVALSAKHIEWYSGECQRVYGRVIPSRAANVRQLVVKEPLGVCVAFTPWNFPFLQAIKKVCAALGAGCTVVLKASEEAPLVTGALVQLLVDAGLPRGCLNVVWGHPPDVSKRLIESAPTRKISFTGSVSVGKQLAQLAGMNMKRSTMELGGHSPAIVFDDVDVDDVASRLALAKVRNAGQTCISPSRIFVHKSVYHRFVDRFVTKMSSVNVGNGLNPESEMGPLCHSRRVDFLTGLVHDAVQQGGEILCGGERLPQPGYFYPPTVLVDLADDSRVMTEEPFGPVAPICIFSDLDEVAQRANSVPYGLASYIFTASSATSFALSTRLESGMVGINHFGLVNPETPFGGIKDSGFGTEGGSEGMDEYIYSKLISQLH